MTTRGSRRFGSLIGAAVASSLAGCGTSNHPAVPTVVPVSTKLSTASADPATAASNAALAAYDAEIAEWVHAGSTADNRDPHLSDHATGQALTNLQLSLASAKSAGLHFDGTPKDDPQVKELIPPTAPSQVFLVSCLDATNWISRKADGSVADTGPNGKHRVEALVAESPAGWKVTRMLIRAVGTC